MTDDEKLTMAQDALKQVADVCQVGMFEMNGIDIGAAARRDASDLLDANRALSDLWLATQGGCTINGLNIGVLAMNTLSAIGGGS